MSAVIVAINDPDLNPWSIDLTLINVHVKLYGTLRRQRPAEVGGNDRQPFAMQAPAGATVALLLSELGVGQGYVGAVALNGETASLDSPLQDGDEIRLFPPSAGG